MGEILPVIRDCNCSIIEIRSSQLSHAAAGYILIQGNWNQIAKVEGTLEHIEKRLDIKIQSIRPDIKDKERKQYTDILHKSTNQLLAVVDNALTLAQIQTKQLQINKISFLPYDMLLNIFEDYNTKKHIVDKSHIEIYFCGILSDKLI